MHFDIKVENGMYICGFRDVLTKCRTGMPGTALGFHNAVSDMIAQVCARVCDDENIKDIALSGGVFQNSFLLEKVTACLMALGFNIFVNELVPSNDGGVALGQVFVGVRRFGRG